MSEQEKINRLLNSIAKGCGGSIADEVRNIIIKQLKEIKELKNNELDYTTIYINGKYDGEKKYKDKIKQTINKYVDIEEHLKYTNQTLFGEALKNMILDLLELIREN